MILAGDIGGTKTTLSLLTRDTSGLLTSVKEQTFPSSEFPAFDDLLVAFLPSDAVIKSACFGVAGPVVGQRCQTTNLPWLLDAEALKAKLDTPKV
ncbi:MAG: glucokinase, partial [Gammaproteobacteria bacterium]